MNEEKLIEEVNEVQRKVEKENEGLSEEEYIHKSFTEAKEGIKRKKAERKEKNFEEKTKNLIFEEDKIAKKCPFTFLKINNDVAAVGLFLPKNTEEKVTKGKITATIKKQIDQPILLLDNETFLEIGAGPEADYIIKIKDQEHIIRFFSIPQNFDRRMSLSSIKKYLLKQYGKIDGKKLFFKIKRKYKKYLYFANSIWYKIHAFWDMGTYFVLLFKAFPLFELRGLRASAKTKTMTTSSFLSFNPTDIMINPSESALFRETHDKRPTKYIDEAEKLFKFEKGKVIADQRAELINASYSYKGVVPRVEKIGNRFVTVYYHVYSPTMIGSINGLYGSTEDRAIIHITTKAPDNDKRGELEPTEESEDWQEIRDELYLFLLQNWKRVEEAYRNFNNDTGLNNRDFQIWKPILVLAKLIDQDSYLEILEYAKKVSQLKKFDYLPEGSLDYNLLKSMKIIFDSDPSRDFIFLIEIQDNLEGEFKPHTRTISKRIDKLGFGDYKDRQHIGSNSGYGYAITKEVFLSIVSSICPNLSSPSSPSSPLYIKTEEIGEEEVKIGEDSCEDGEDGEVGELHNPLQFDPKLAIYMPCSVKNCSETLCNYDGKNIPFCKKHFVELAKK